MDNDKLYIHVEKIIFQVISINIYSIFNDWSDINYFCHRFAEELILKGDRAEVRLENDQFVLIWKPRDENDKSPVIVYSYQIENETFRLARAAFKMKSYETIIDKDKLYCEHFEEQISSEDITPPIKNIGFNIYPRIN